MNFFDFLKKFPSESSIVKHYIQIRYKNKTPHCNHCGSVKVYHYNNESKIKFFRCAECNKDFSVFKDTMFEHSSTELRKWFFAIHLFLNGKKGISGLQLQREIGVTYKTAWRILQKIREAMGKDDNDDDFTGLMQGIIEADETYVGGKEENKHKHKKFTSAKSIIFGMINREKKLAKAFYVKASTYIELAEKIMGNVDFGSTLITDEHKAYTMLRLYYNHKTINHSAKEYVKEDNIHTNTIEGFWSTFKRGVYGIYHHVSKRHLQKYVNEFCFRYNNRENEDVFDLVLANSVNKNVKRVKFDF
jgi:transposase-like protein